MAHASSVNGTASQPGKRRASFLGAEWALVIGGLRGRGWTWLLSMLWVVTGAAGTGYDFYITTKPFTWADVNLGIEGWATDLVVVQIAVVLATVAWLALLLPVLVAGVVQLRGWRPPNRPRTAAWVGAWVAGIGLMYQAEVWGEYPGWTDTRFPAIGSPAVVSWGEMAICAAWLALGAVMIQVLPRPGKRSDHQR